MAWRFASEAYASQPSTARLHSGTVTAVEIAIFVFERITALDAVGPYEVLSRIPQARVRFVGSQAGPVRTDNGSLSLVADHAIADVPSPDLLLVPGGFGTRALEDDATVLDWIRRAHEHTTWTTSVCTGSLLLAAAGLLEGKRATTHWSQLDKLERYGATPVSERWVRQGKIWTAAGVSAGIDMALALLAEQAGDSIAQQVQLAIEYSPAPPFDSGTPQTAPAHVLAAVKDRIAKNM